MRTFLLIDNDGNTYNVSTKNDVFFYGITGMGYQKETEFQRIKERYYLARKYFAQQVIRGTVKFWQPNAEEKYIEFAQFLQNSPLKMVFNPTSSNIEEDSNGNYVENTNLYLSSSYLSKTNYYRDGYVTAIAKSDGMGNVLTVTIDFTATTPWYKSVSSYNLGNDSGSGKKYSYQYSYNYSELVPNTITIKSDSRQESPIKLVIMGEAVNPEWKYYLDGNLLATGKLNGTVPSDCRLVVDTTAMPYSIKIIDAIGTVVADVYQLSDFETERFIRLGYGKNVITVSDDNESTLGLGVEAQIEYATI